MIFKIKKLTSRFILIYQFDIYGKIKLLASQKTIKNQSIKVNGASTKLKYLFIKITYKKFKNL